MRGRRGGASGERAERAGGGGEREKGSARRKERKRGVSKRVVGGGKPLQTKETTKKGGLDDLSEQSHLFFFVVFSWEREGAFSVFEPGQESEVNPKAKVDASD